MSNRKKNVVNTMEGFRLRQTQRRIIKKLDKRLLQLQEMVENSSTNIMGDKKFCMVSGFFEEGLDSARYYGIEIGSYEERYETLVDHLSERDNLEFHLAYHEIFVRKQLKKLSSSRSKAPRVISTRHVGNYKCTFGGIVYFV